MVQEPFSFRPLAQRLLLGYIIILSGLGIFLLRRFVFPIDVEAQGLPIEIAIPTVLQFCYETPTLSTCNDPMLVLFTELALLVGLGRGNFVAAVFGVILSLPALALYFLLAPTWLILTAFLLIPFEVGIVLLIAFRDYAF